LKLTKAIKKEKNNNKIFFSLMIFLLIILPFIAYLFQTTSKILIIYLLFLESLIIFACFNKINYILLKYDFKYNKLKIKEGFIRKNILIYCDKVILIHTKNYKSEMEIIIVSTSKFRNKYFQKIDVKFLKKYPDISNLYSQIKSLNPEEIYYYKVIKYGGLKKYNLLNDIFKNCVKAQYSSEAIENIKIAREEKEFE